MRRLVVALALILSSTGCATHQAYLSPQFSSATAAHRQVAILPFDVSISRERLPRNLTAEDLDRAEREEGYAVQSKLYTQLLRHSGQYTVAFQDVSETNVLLQRAGLTYDSLDSRTKQEIAKLLNVDAVISGRIQRSKPTAVGTALLMGALLGPAFMGNTNSVGVNLQLHDGGEGAVLWTFAHRFGGSIGSSPEGLAEAMMGSIARRFPYRRTVTSGTTGPSVR
ncbi:MAG TPA: hypothetical protein VHG91_13430 [Longimicrobium sp.]|nr:hypothetical protein [Longimicrobium sp.]